MTDSEKSLALNNISFARENNKSIGRASDALHYLISELVDSTKDTVLRSKLELIKQVINSLNELCNNAAVYVSLIDLVDLVQHQKTEPNKEEAENEN